MDRASTAARAGSDSLPRGLYPWFPGKHELFQHRNVIKRALRRKNSAAAVLDHRRLNVQIFINCYPPAMQFGLLRAYQDQSVEADGPEMVQIQDAAARCK